MTFRDPRSSNRTPCWLLIGLLLFSTGCADEPISSYTAPRPDGQKQEAFVPPKLDLPPMAKNDSGGASGSPRILGAVITDKGTNFYVKLTGPSETLDKFAAQFDQFVASLKFTGKNESPFSWTLPEGWKPGKGNQFSLAAFALPVEGRPIEVTISQAGGPLLDNINRWLGQVGRSPVSDAGFVEVAKATEIDGRKAYRVDLKGEAKPPIQPPMTPKTIDAPSNDAAMRVLGLAIPNDQMTIYVKIMGPAEFVEKNEAGFDQFLASLKFTGTPNQPLSWKVPEGWKPGKGNQFSFGAFVLPGATSKSTELTLSSVGGPLLDNLNRWRGQVGLPGVDPSKMGEVSKEIQIDGRKAYRVNFKGTGGASGMMVPPFMKK